MQSATHSVPCKRRSHPPAQLLRALLSLPMCLLPLPLLRPLHGM